MTGPVKDILALGVHRSIALQVIFGSSVLMIMGANVVYPVLPVVADSLGIAKGQIGLVFTAFSLPAVFLAPLGGFLIDRRGRKQVLVVCLLLYGLAGASIVFVNGLLPLLALRFAQGVAYAAIMPLVVVLIGDTFTREQETTAQGVKVIFDRGTLLVLPAVAGALAAITWQLPFVLYAAAIPLALVAARWLREPMIQRHSNAPLYVREVLRAALRVRSFVVFSMSAMRFFLEVSFFTYVPLFALDRLGVEVAKGGLLFTVYALGSIATASMVGTFARRFDRFAIVVAAFALQGVCLLTAASSMSVWMLGAAMLVFGLANGVISPAQKSLLTQSVDGSLRGGFVAADRIAQNTAKTIAPLIAGTVVVFASIPTMFELLAVIAFAWSVGVVSLYIAGWPRASRVEVTPGAEIDG